MFGYSNVLREIDHCRSIKIGSSERVVPDIIIKDGVQNKDLFVVELKQLNMVYNLNYKNQLRSYMSLLGLKVGILICDKIYVYYIEDFESEYSTEIDFKLDNKKGEQFVALFSKDNFSYEKVKDFLITISKTSENVNKIKSDLKERNIKEIIKEFYLKEYGDEEIELALKDVEIQVYDCKESGIDLTKEYGTGLDESYTIKGSITKDNTKYKFNGQQYGKGRLVLAVIKQYMQDNPMISVEKLMTIFPKEIQGSIGVVVLWSEVKLKCKDPEKRFYLKEIIKTSTKECVVCSQWGIANIDNFINKARSLGIKIDVIKSK